MQKRVELDNENSLENKANSRKRLKQPFDPNCPLAYTRKNLLSPEGFLLLSSVSCGRHSTWMYYVVTIEGDRTWLYSVQHAC